MVFSLTKSGEANVRLPENKIIISLPNKEGPITMKPYFRNEIRNCGIGHPKLLNKQEYDLLHKTQVILPIKVMKWSLKRQNIKMAILKCLWLIQRVRVTNIQVGSD
jgi:hypothetical protein